VDHSKKENSKAEKARLSRRQALKALIALGGASTLSTLPNKWKKPLVEVGALPVFAQISPTPSPSSLNISDLSVSDRQAGCDPGGGEPGDLFLVSLSYTDPDGLTPDEARLRITFEFLPSHSMDSDQIVLGPINITGGENGFQWGTVTVPICVAFGSDTSVNLTVSLINQEGLVSNELTANVVNPASPMGGQPRATILES
jgi:hypothetical protein